MREEPIKLRTFDEIMNNDGTTGWNNYLGTHDETDNWLVFLSRHRDSDVLAESNFFVGLRRLGGECNGVTVRKRGHWAVGWVEFILIDPSKTQLVQKAEKILEETKVYPILDEEDYRDRVWKRDHADGVCFSDDRDCECGLEKA